MMFDDLLRNAEFETEEGLWRIEQIDERQPLLAGDRIDCYILLKWFGNESSEGTLTAERRVRLTAYASQTAAPDWQERRIKAIAPGLINLDFEMARDVEEKLRFGYELRSLLRLPE